MTREEAIQILSTRDAHGVLCGYTSGVTEALDMAIEALKADVARWSSWNKTFEQSGIADLISRADVHKTLSLLATEGGADAKMLLMDAHEFIDALPSADAVQGYTEWLEDIIVKAETLEWLCEDTPCKEWCDENCHYSSIQAECLRHLYEVSKGGDTE